MSEKVKVIECPRDAMQGIKTFIPTEDKVKYIQALLGCGFDTIDFGSFVSPKAIPQMVDTADVLAQLDLSETESKLLAIVANVRGAKNASERAPADRFRWRCSFRLQAVESDPARRRIRSFSSRSRRSAALPTRAS